MLRKTFIIMALSLMVFPLLKAQQIEGELTLEKAIGVAMTNNYDLKIAENQLQQAKNNNTIGNAGLLPSVSVNGGADYDFTDSESENKIWGVIKNEDASSTGYNGNARIDYALFDGFGNRYNYKKLQQTDERQQILFKQQMENTMLNVVQSYYTVCSAQQVLRLAKASMEISKERYQKALDRKVYGQANSLAVLNAEVDMNTDSTRILNAEQNYVTAIKDLNVVLGAPVNSTYSVNEDLSFEKLFTSEQVVASALTHNTYLQSQLKQEEITSLDLKLAQAGKYPTISAYGQYGYNRTDFTNNNSIYSQSNGVNTGLSLKFNVFNGGQQRTREKNAKLNILSEQERTLQLKSELERDAANAYTDYAYKKQIIELEERSMAQARLNFEQTQEMFKLGSVTSIEFRTAQQNLLNVAFNYNDARFNAKVAEFNLLRITGELVKN
ncbi:TolC family protein [Labilibacter marinus]|uniref:TolC family protein n=1 Tax=Labilibacter marinus TaxID=1477105 RepID=UPI00082C547A|nr:TolC family protein [Labilibacter marinus]